MPNPRSLRHEPAISRCQPPLDLAIAWAFVSALTLSGAAATAHADTPLLSFAQTVAAAAHETPASRIAELRTNEARSRVSEARGVLLPSLTGTASQVNRTANIKTAGFPLPPSIPDKIGPYDVMDARIGVRQPLLDASGWYHLGAARSDVAKAVAEGDLTREQATQNAAVAYLRAARARALVAAREEDVRIAAELLDIAQRQQLAGTALAIDTTRARSQLVAALGGALLARNAADRTRIDLARALGIDPRNPPQLTDTLSEQLGDSSAPTDSAEATAFAHTHRPELVAEQARLGTTRTEHTAIAAERIPRVEVLADWGVSGVSWDESFPTRQYGAALTLPLIDGFAREARLAETTSRQHESEVRLGDLNDQVAAEVATAELDLAASREQLRLADERVTLANAELSQAREAFVGGVGGNIEVIDAQSSMVRARDVQIEARYAIAASRVALARAAGVARTLH